MKINSNAHLYFNTKAEEKHLVYKYIVKLEKAKENTVNIFCCWDLVCCFDYLNTYFCEKSMDEWDGGMELF